MPIQEPDRRVTTSAVAAASEPSSDGLERLVEFLWALVPGGMVVFMGFNAGGYFPGTTAAAAAAAAVLLAVRIATCERWFLRGTAILTALAGMGGYAAWTLLSVGWSHAPARGLVAFDRAVLYGVVIALSASLTGRPETQRMLIRGLAVGLVVVSGAGLLSRTLPRVFPVTPGFLNERLSYPVTYWNALGMLTVLGIALCVHLAGDVEERTAVRVLSAAMVAPLAVTLLLTYSRGSILALAVALLVYTLMMPQVSVLLTAVCVAPATAIAVRTAYDARQLSGEHPTAAAAVAQGHHVIAVLAGATIVTGLLGTALLRGDRFGGRFPRHTGIVTLSVILVAAVVIAGALDLPHWLSREYHAFVAGDVVPVGPAQARLTSVANNGRLALWHVALEAFRAKPIDGNGAGTYAVLWSRLRPNYGYYQNAHSLYLETLAELGIVGTAFLGIALGALALGAVRRRVRQSENRGIASVTIAALVAWAVHGAMDWDWQMPVVTIPVLCLAGAAAARAWRDRGAGAANGAGGRTRSSRLTQVARGVAGLCCIGLAVAPAFAAVSQAHLDDSLHAFARHDCEQARSSARAALAVVSSRPEPLEVIGYCDIRHRSPAAAVRAMSRAVARDPDNWQVHYALAIAEGADRRSPYPQLEAARVLDPREIRIYQAKVDFQLARRRRWPAVAARVPSLLN